MDFANHSKTWLSQGLETLAATPSDQQQKKHSKHFFDIVIIGSGYGASIAANELSQVRDTNGNKPSIAIFERGREYPPGSFASSAEEVATHIRFSGNDPAQQGGAGDGLYDFRFGPDLCVVLANGVGGGSLINAGVMAQAKSEVFDHRWPHQYANGSALVDAYSEVSALLGAKTSATSNTILQHNDAQKIKKTEALRRLSGGRNFTEAPISICTQQGNNEAGVELNACILCGDCAAGCNHGAKNSLDQNLLKKSQLSGASIFTGATASHFSQKGQGNWIVTLNYTDSKLSEKLAPLEVEAGKLIIAAGSLGTTELLLRTQATGDLDFSTQLGHNFSSNGDNFIGHYNHREQANAVAIASDRPSQRFVGPTITGMIDRRHSDGIVIQEMSVAAHLNRIFTEVCCTVDLLHGFAEAEKTKHCSNQKAADPFAVHNRFFDHTSVYAAMGEDGSSGRLKLREDFGDHADGSLTIEWPELKEHQLFVDQVNLIETLALQNDAGGRVIANPFWQLLPKSLMSLIGDNKGPTVTVHPLGGCSMADNATKGVTDHLGRVFDTRFGRTDETYNNLVVLDGSLLPCAVGINPALTIAAISLYAIRSLAQEWGYQKKPFNLPKTIGAPPIYRNVDKAVLPDQCTEFTVHERLHGRATLKSKHQTSLPVVIEITFITQSAPIAPHLEITTPPRKIGDQTLNIDSLKNRSDGTRISKVRVYSASNWEQAKSLYTTERSIEERLDDLAIYVAGLTGQLTLFARDTSSLTQRLRSAGKAWLVNRGIRDFGQSFIPKYYEAAGQWMFGTFIPVASRAGSRWTINYDFRISAVHKNTAALPTNSITICGKKTITYSANANPWRQLSEVALVQFPGFISENSESIWLNLNPHYLYREKTALYQISKQSNQISASLDLLSFAMYNIRLLLHTHLWSFRLPDKRLPEKTEVPSYTKACEINRFAREEKNLPQPKIFWLNCPREKDPSSTVDTTSQNIPVRIRLSLYAHPNNTSIRNPVLMLHGYSASSTTFSHPALSNSAANYFFHQGHDIWLIDFRSSAALATAKEFWRFEDIAAIDIPQALFFIDQHYRRERRVNIIAHCMGGAMLTMAIASKDNSVELDKFYGRVIDRIAFSQFSPTPVFSPFNTFRAMIANALKPIFSDNYAFRGSSSPSLLDDLFDRLLSTLPYSDKEFRLLNPPKLLGRRVFTRSKQRADALYSRVINVCETDLEVLDHFDDFFGPLHLETATQVMHFARSNRVTNALGHSIYIDPSTLRRKWRFPTYSIHSPRNGMIDSHSGELAKEIFSAAGVDYESHIVDNEAQGHQDAMLGRRAYKTVFPQIASFFSNDHEVAIRAPRSSAANPPVCWQCHTVAAGPVIIPSQDNARMRIGFGSHFGLTAATLPLLIPVRQTSQGYSIAGENSLDVINQSLTESLENIFVWRDEKLSPTWTVLDVASAMFSNQQFNHDKPDGWLLCHLSEKTGQFEILPSTSNNFSEENPPAGFYRTGLAPVAPLADGENQSDLTKLFLQSIEVQLHDETSSELERCILNINVDETSPKTLCFALGSCQYPGGIFDRDIAYRSYGNLARLMEQAHCPINFLLLMGDQVYTDPTAGFLDPRNRHDRFVGPYLHLYSQPEVRNVLRRLPMYCILDDHEIINDWGPERDESESQSDYLDLGTAAYLKFQRGSVFADNCNKDPAESKSGSPQKKLWYAFEECGHNFFMIDSRTDRMPRNADNILDPNTQIIKPQQRADLENWLQDVSQTEKPAFVVSPSLLLPRHVTTHGGDTKCANALHLDGWDGFPASLHWILKFLHDHSVKNIYFLSGDEHINCYAHIKITSTDNPEKSTEVRSIHCSGLYAPFPFANAKVEDFVGSKLSALDTNPRDAERAGIYLDVFSFSTPEKSGSSKSAVTEKSARYLCECHFTFDYNAVNKIDPGRKISLRDADGFSIIETIQ